MKIRLVLRPGNRGTKALLRKYGERLIAVRFHYDPVSRQRIKSVELVEEIVPWEKRRRPSAHKVVALRTPAGDRTLHRKLMAAGARWDFSERVWRLKYAVVAKFGWVGYVVER